MSSADLTTAIEAMRTIGDLVGEEVTRELREDAPALRAALDRGWPAPVLSISGANRLETPWTAYLAHMVDPSRAGEVGRRLGPALFSHLTSRRVDPGELVVLSEVWLGRAKCPDCDHDCVIDLVLASPTHVAFVEQKVTSPPSDWRCRRAGKRHRQLQEYGRLVEDWTGREHQRLFGRASQPSTSCHYLTLGGATSEPDWQPVSHRELSEVGLDQLGSLRDPVARHTLAAMILDWNAEPFGNWPELLEELGAIVPRQPSEISLRVALRYAAILEVEPRLRAFLLDPVESP